MRDSASATIDLEALSRLAAGIIPADHRDGGAASENAGPKVALRIQTSSSRSLYEDGLTKAAMLAVERYGKSLSDLDDNEVSGLLEQIREQNLPFFRQLRADVCAVYLSDPIVWKRIGFPGPSAASGGYPDFDQPTTETE